MIRRRCVKGWLNGCRAEHSPGKYAFNFNIASEKKDHTHLTMLFEDLARNASAGKQ